MWRCYEGLNDTPNFSEQLKPRVYFSHTLTKRQQRKNADQLGLIINEDMVKERRLVLGVEELSVQCKSQELGRGGQVHGGKG